mmetsp:Transcript_10382/g.32862  ORF Transcript_10382/g.32862 Transcript_10382/m.32862 type:complete len:203 (-) Transcript_10382:235-843(-)
MSPSLSSRGRTLQSASRALRPRPSNGTEASQPGSSSLSPRRLTPLSSSRPVRYPASTAHPPSCTPPPQRSRRRWGAARASRPREARGRPSLRWPLPTCTGCSRSTRPSTTCPPPYPPTRRCSSSCAAGQRAARRPSRPPRRSAWRRCPARWGVAGSACLPSCGAAPATRTNGAPRCCTSCCLPSPRRCARRRPARRWAAWRP